MRELLFEKKIKSHLAGVTNSPDEFFLEDSIVVTSIYRAKGNEAAMVYVMDADYCYDGYGLIKRRNSLFTAITRSKAWVRVCGIGENMVQLIEEFNKIKGLPDERKFRLRFKYPTIVEMEKLNTINRDKSESEVKDIDKVNKGIASVIEKIATGKVQAEDLVLSDVEKEILRKLLANDK